MVRATMILATIVWAIGEAMMMRHTATHGQRARAVWTLGLILAIVHVVLAFQFVYEWDHQAAIAATMQQTIDRFGQGWSGGIYVNYAFLLIWIADVGWWWIGPASRAARPRWIDRGRLAFFIFMFVNGAIVFASGIGRLVGIAALMLVIIATIGPKQR